MRLVLAAVLAGASVAKLASPGSSQAAMASFGVEGRRAQAFAWGLVIAAELALAVGVAAGSETAAWLAAVLMAAFAATMVAAIMRGHAGAPCACFGARSTVGWAGVARNLALAGAFAGLTFLPAEQLTTDEWLGLGLGAALLACAGLVIAVLALAREIGMLRLRVGPEGALEIAEEGPPLGSRTELVERFEFEPEAELALAVFTSRECRVCRSLEPAVAALSREPLLAIAGFDEADEPEVWERLRVPGSPFAIALDRAGTVLAKGTFNNLAQLETVLGAAERRRAERRLAGAVGV